MDADIRPREKLQRYGEEELSEQELVAIILNTGSQREPVQRLAETLLHEFGLKRMQQAEVDELTAFDGIGPVKATRLKACFELARRGSQEHIETLSHLDDVKALFTPKLRGLQQEELHAAFVDSANRLKKVERFFKGSLKGLKIEKREILRKALQVNCSAVILAHNHPGGHCEPSDADILTTKSIKRSLDEFNISLLDHIIVGEEAVSSMRKRELL